MPNPIASGLKTIIDLSDGMQLTTYLECNLSKIQIYDTNAPAADAYTPDWSNTPLIITPQFFVGSSAEDLASGNITGLVWSYKRTGDTEETRVVSGSDSMAIDPSTGALTVSANKMSALTVYKQITFIVSAYYRDPNTRMETLIKSDVSFSLVTTGSNAASLKLSGDQAIRYAMDNGAAMYTPAVATLEASFANIEQSTLRWSYIGEEETAIDNDGRSTLTVSPASAMFINGVAKIKCAGTDVAGGIHYDTFSVHIISEAPSIFLTNENLSFAADSEGIVVNSAVERCNIVAYMGTNKVTPVVGSISYDPSLPAGLSVSQTGVEDSEVQMMITVAPNSTLSGDSGSIVLHITSPVETDLNITWNKVKNGSIGENAIVFSLYCPDGLVFINKTGEKTIRAQAYDGSVPITSATYSWYKYDPSQTGGWSAALTTQANAYVVDGSTLTVYADEVPSEATYKCEMLYRNNTYTDVITLTDKTDNYQVVIDSTKGDVFKNAIGDTCLICHLWQNGEMIDAVKTTTISDVPPASGDYFYFLDRANKTVVLEKRVNDVWTRVQAGSDDDYVYTYHWSKRNKDGEADGTFSRTGKVIYINSDDVDNKSVFVCTVSI